MERLVQFLFDTASFMPHGYCLIWRPELVWMHGISDTVIAMAYFTIPAAILTLLSRRRDLLDPRVAWLFVIFITLCGITHAVALMTIWLPVYGAQGLIKMVTALVSGLTAFLLWRMMPLALMQPSRLQIAEASAEIQVRNRLADELRRSNKELERFASVAAHDLREPLRAVSVISEWIDEELHTKEPDRALLYEHTDLLRKQADRMGSLVLSLLDYSKIGSEGTHAREIDTAKLAEEAIGLVVQPEGVSVRTEGEFPRLRAVRAEVALILRNLISNAIKYHDREDGMVVVRSLGAVDGVYRFEVEDDGPGVPAEMAESIFEPFFKLESRDRVEGTGLGLAMVRRAVEASGGEVTCRPGPGGRGTVFAFTLRSSPGTGEPAETRADASEGEEMPLLARTG